MFSHHYSSTLRSLLIVIVLMMHTPLKGRTHPVNKKSTWIETPHPYIGGWRGNGMTLILSSNGEAKIRQRGLFNSRSESKLRTFSQETSVEIDEGSELITLYGYWWSEADLLCLSFELRAQCLPSRLRSQRLRTLLSIKLSQIWIDLKKDN